MKLKKLIVVRHGNFGYHGLTEAGRDEIEGAAVKISDYVEGKATVMFSSPAERAIQSAEIISEMLDIGFDIKQAIDSNRQYNQAATLELVKKHMDEAEIIILVSHLECATYFPPFFAWKLFDTRIFCEDAYYGDVVIFDCETASLI